MKANEDVMEQARAKARRICTSRGWAHDKPIFNRVVDIVYTQLIKKLEPNNALFDSDKLMFEHPVFPRRGTKEMACLILLYNNEKTLRELGAELESSQAAATIRTLVKKYFFMFKKNENSKTEYNVYNSEKGERCRQITDCDVDAALKYINQPRTDPTLTEAFRKLYTDPLSGNRDSIEVDHRMPNEASRTLGVRIRDPSWDLVADGTFFKYFQPLSKSLNNFKREVCVACLHHKPIWVPDWVDREAYKKEWEVPEKGCKGCFWHNYAEPLHPEVLSKATLAHLKQQQATNENTEPLQAALRARNAVKKGE
jgi:hypothetical protein